MPEISGLSHVPSEGTDRQSQPFSEGRPPAVRPPPPQPARSDASGERFHRPPGKAGEPSKPIPGPPRRSSHSEEVKETSTSTGPSADEGVSIPLTPQPQLFVQGEGDSSDLDETDIFQGELGDCYLLGSLGALARQNPDFLKQHIRDNGNGTYTVDFYQKQEKLVPPLNPFSVFESDKYVKVPVTVTKEQILKPDGMPQKGAGFGDIDLYTGNQEVWPLVVEKAYAQWRAAYGEVIHKGGSPAVAQEQLTSQAGEVVNVGDLSIDALRYRLAKGDAITLATNDNGKHGWKSTVRHLLGNNATDVLYRQGTLLPSHCYTVIGATEKDVHLINPHDGNTIITLSFADLERACSYGWFTIGQSRK